MANSVAALFAADMVGADLSAGEVFQQVYADQVNVGTWCLAGGGRQPVAVARVRGARLGIEFRIGGGERILPRGFRGPLGTSGRESARQHSIAIE